MIVCSGCKNHIKCRNVYEQTKEFRIKEPARVKVCPGYRFCKYYGELSMPANVDNPYGPCSEPGRDTFPFYAKLIQDAEDYANKGME